MSNKIVEDWVAKYGNNPEVDKIVNERVEYMAKIKATVKKDSPAADILKAAKKEKQAFKEAVESGKINLQEVPQDQLEQERNSNYEYFDIDDKKQTAVEWLESEIKKIRNIIPKVLFEKAKQMEKEQEHSKEYPELEGTVKLTEDIILKREIYNWLSTRFTEDAPLHYIIREYRKKFLNER